MVTHDVLSFAPTERSRTVVVNMGEKAFPLPLGTTVECALGNTKAVAGRLDNEVVPLQQAIVGTPCSLEGVPMDSPDGIRVLVETLKFLLKIAKHECYPEWAILINKPIGSAYFCQFYEKVTKAPVTPTEDQLRNLEGKMSSLIDSGIPLMYKQVSSQHAIEVMSRTGAGFSAEMLADSCGTQVVIVEACGMYHIPRSPVMSNTDMLPKDSFRLSSFKEGFFLEHFRLDSKTHELKLYREAPSIADLLYREFMERKRWTHDVELSHIAQLNSAIRSGNSKKVVQAVEANCDRQFVELAAQIQSRENCKLVLIAGPSSSGKTTFAKRLQVQLESLGLKPQVLSVDSFYRPWQDINTEGMHKVDWESLDSLNLPQLNECLLTLMKGEKALIPEYDMKVSMPMAKSHWDTMQLDASGKGLIIMEGIHCLNPELTEAVPRNQKFHIAIAPIPALMLDGSHVLSGTTIRMVRRMVRDHYFRGRPVLATLRQWPSVAAGEVNNIYPHQGNADVVMNSEIAYEMSVLKVHAEPLLRTVKATEKEYSEVARILKTLDQFVALPTDFIPPQSLIREFIGGSWYYDHGGWYKSY